MFSKSPSHLHLVASNNQDRLSVGDHGAEKTVLDLAFEPLAHLTDEVRALADPFFGPLGSSAFLGSNGAPGDLGDLGPVINAVAGVVLNDDSVYSLSNGRILESLAANPPATQIDASNDYGLAEKVQANDNFADDPLSAIWDERPQLDDALTMADIVMPHDDVLEVATALHDMPEFSLAQESMQYDADNALDNDLDLFIEKPGLGASHDASHGDSMIDSIFD